MSIVGVKKEVINNKQLLSRRLLVKRFIEVKKLKIILHNEYNISRSSLRLNKAQVGPTVTKYNYKEVLFFLLESKIPIKPMHAIITPKGSIPNP